MSGDRPSAGDREQVPPAALDALGEMDRPGLVPAHPFPLPRGRTRELTARLLRRLDAEALSSAQGPQELGMTALAVPEEHGGLGLELPGELRLLREMARHDAGTALALAAHGTVARTLAEMPHPGAARGWLGRLGSGHVRATHGLREAPDPPRVGGNGRRGSGLPVVAHRSEDGEGWSLRGAVPTVVSAAQAHVFLIPGRLASGPDAGADPGQGRRLFLIEAADGVAVRRPPEDGQGPLGIPRAGVAAIELSRVVAELTAHLGAIDEPDADRRAEEAIHQTQVRDLLSTAAVSHGLAEGLLLLALALGDVDGRGDVRSRLAEAAAGVRALEATMDLAAHAHQADPGRASAKVEALVCGALAHEVLTRSAGLVGSLAGASATIDRGPALSAILDAVALAGLPVPTHVLEEELGDALATLLEARGGPRRSATAPRPPRPSRVFGILGGGRRGDDESKVGRLAVDPADAALVAGWLLSEARDLASREPSPEGRARRRRIARVATSFQALGAVMGQAMERTERLDGERAAPDRALARTFARQAVARWRAAGLGVSTGDATLTAAVDDAGRILRALGDPARGFPPDRSGWG